MNRVIFNLPVIGKVSGWPLSHFVLFLVLGLLFPGCDLLVLSIGVGWEIWEEIFGRYVVGDREKVPLFYSDSSKEEDLDIQYTRWWSGSLKDVGFNFVGFYFGKLVVHTFNLDIKIPYINKDV